MAGPRLFISELAALIEGLDPRRPIPYPHRVHICNGPIFMKFGIIRRIILVVIFAGVLFLIFLGIVIDEVLFDLS